MDQNIRLAIVQQLENILHQDKDTRTSGEEKLNQLKFTEGYGVHLSEIVVNCNLNLSLRQLASLMLKKYVEAHWNLETDEDPSKLVVTDQAKKAIFVFILHKFLWIFSPYFDLFLCDLHVD